MEQPSTSAPSSAEVPQEIQTFIFMDFETTGLIEKDSRDPLERKAIPGQKNRNLEELLKAYIRLGYDRPEQMPRITEMSFVALARSILIECVENMQSLSNLLEGDADEPLTVSAAVNVHTRQVDPQLSERDWVEYERQRRQCDSMYLSRADLIVKNTFREEWPGVCSFLQLCRKPACFVAHNGARFDYRILFCELQRNALLDEFPLPDQIFFVDSYLAFMDLEKEYHASIGTAVKCIDWRLVTQAVMTAASTPERKDERSITIDVVTTEPTATAGAQSTSTTPQRDPKVERALKRRMPRLHLTPDAKRGSPVRDAENGCGSPHISGDASSSKAKKRLFADVSDAHPLRFMRKDDWSPAKKRRLRNQMFSRSDRGDWQFDEHRAFRHFHDRGNFKLGELFREIVNDDFRAHRAQEDCEALLQTCVAYGRDFLDYADRYRADFRFFRPNSSAASSKGQAKSVEIAVESTTTTTTTRTVQKSAAKLVVPAGADAGTAAEEVVQVPEEPEAESTTEEAATKPSDASARSEDVDDDDGGWLNPRGKPL